MIRLLQVPDPHFGTEQPAVLEALLAMARACRPDVLLLSGDITQRARRAQFAAAAAFAAAVPARVRVAIPGNHDVPLLDLPRRLFAPYQRYAEAFGEDLEPALDLPDLLLLCVNTTRRWRHKHGEVSATQIERVAARLRGAGPGQLRVVVTHQPVDVPQESERNDLLRGHDRAVRAWAAAGADVLMGGHIHWPFVRPLSQRFPDLARAAWCVQAGTAVSRRVRAGHPNSVNLLDYDGGGREAVLLRWDYQPGRGFAVAARQALALAR